MKLLGAATVRLLLHDRDDVAEQPIPDRARGGVVAIGVGEDARAALGAERAAHVVGVLAHPDRDGFALQLRVELEAELRRPIRNAWWRQTGVDARCTAPAGRSYVSPCQCTTSGCAGRPASAGSRSAPIRSTGPQPTSRAGTGLPSGPGRVFG